MNRLNLLVMVAALALFTGCTSVLEGEDPVVVRSEQLQDAAVDTVDIFLLFEKNNRATLQELSPEIRAAADKLRAQFPPALQSLKDTTRAYKRNRTEANRVSVQTAQAILEQFRQEAVKWFKVTQQ